MTELSKLENGNEEKGKGRNRKEEREKNPPHDCSKEMKIQVRIVSIKKLRIPVKVSKLNKYLKYLGSK